MRGASTTVRTAVPTTDVRVAKNGQKGLLKKLTHYPHTGDVDPVTIAR
jgi:hypothetical protein